MTQVKKILVTAYVLLIVYCGKAQNIDTITTLDSFFAGIPVQQGFAKWVEYLYKHPNMGLDSANNRGSYSSLKSGASHYPFPDSIQVKILAGDELFDIKGVKKLVRSHDLYIEGVFGNHKRSEKNTWKCYGQLHKLFKKYYSVRNSGFSSVYYKKGVNDKFPDFSMHIGFSPELNFYYILLIYEEDDVTLSNKTSE